ncbi:MAG: zinc ribbon domain-containing protein [Limisphaerales bacterium]
MSGRAPETCPNCGGDIPRGARACPECGADERTGWSDQAVVDRLDLPGSEDFDHDEFVRREFGGSGRGRSGIPSWVGWVALGLLAALLAGVFL